MEGGGGTPTQPKKQKPENEDQENVDTHIYKSVSRMNPIINLDVTAHLEGVCELHLLTSISLGPKN